MKLKRYVCLCAIFTSLVWAIWLYAFEASDQVEQSDDKVAQQYQSPIQGSESSQTAPNPSLPEYSAIVIPVILDASERAEIFPEISETVESIPFKLGQRFKKGDILLKMKNYVYRSLLDKAILGIDYAKEDLRVKESLRESNLISQLELMQSKFNLATAQAQKDEASKNYKATMVIAPFDGRIGALHIREYERPVPQKSMLEIFNDRKIIARMIIPSSYLPQFAIGQKIRIYVRDLGRKVGARVKHIGAEINPVSGTVNLEAEIDNSDGTLVIGMVSFLTLDGPQK